VVVHSLNTDSALAAMMGSGWSVNVAGGTKFEFSEVGTDCHDVGDLNVRPAELIFGYFDVSEIVFVFVSLSK
jgi:hypothetical protein